MKSTKRANLLLADLAKKFSEESFPDVAGEAYLERMSIPSDAWSYFNRLYMMLEGTRDARGYRQWQSVNRHVRKGSKAIYILGPRHVSVKEKDEETGESKEAKILVGFRCIPVFRVEDTEGVPVEYVRDPPPLPPLYAVAKSWGIDVIHDGTSHGERGSFNASTGEIRLCVANPSTFFHELAHAAHSKIEDLKPGQDPEQEAVAQLTACVLARLYKTKDVEAYTWNYVASYACERSPEEVGKLCYAVMRKVQRVLELILN